jgi:hypothetical protein
MKPPMIRTSKVYVSGIRLTMNQSKYIQVIDEAGWIWALIPYGDKTPEEHAQAYSDAKIIVDALNEGLDAEA